MRYMPSRTASRMHRQQGMALLIALVVLVVVSILGVVSMRTALFQNRVSINNQTETLAFQAAESGLKAAMALAANGPDGIADTADDIGVEPSSTAHIFGASVNAGVPRRVCVRDDGGYDVFNDGIQESQHMVGFQDGDECPPQAGSQVSVTVVVGPVCNDGRPIEGYDIEGYSKITIQLRSEGEVLNTDIRAVNVEEWDSLAPGEGFVCT